MTTPLMSNNNHLTTQATPQFPVLQTRVKVESLLTTSTDALPGKGWRLLVVGIPTCDVTHGIWFNGPMDPHVGVEFAAIGYHGGAAVAGTTAQYAIYGIAEVVGQGNVIEYRYDLILELTTTFGAGIVATNSAIYPATSAYAEAITVDTDYSLGGATVKNISGGRATVIFDGIGYIGYVVVGGSLGDEPVERCGFEMRPF